MNKRSNFKNCCVKISNYFLVFHYFIVYSNPYLKNALKIKFLCKFSIKLYYVIMVR